MKSSLLVLIFLCLTLAVGYVSNAASTQMQYKNTQGVFSEYDLVDREVINVSMEKLIRCFFDRNVGNGMVKGFFIMFNGKSRAWLIMLFCKLIPPGQVAFDLLCKSIHVTVRDVFNDTYYECEINRDAEYLFANNWVGSLEFMKPDYGDFFVVEIEIYGNYE